MTDMETEKKPGILQIMRLASSKEFQADIRRSQAQLLHGHCMLATLHGDIHEHIHASVRDEERRKKLGDEMNEGVEAGACLYRMIGLLYAKKFGMPEFNRLKTLFPGVD